MQALQMTFSLPRYVLARLVGALNRQAYYGPLAMLRYREVPDPQLPGPEWVRIRTIYGGICGSDLHTLMLQNSPSLSAFSSFPFVLGHENVGTIDEVGAAISDLTFGERVVAEPLLGCTARGFSEPCEYCARGEIALCRSFSEGKLKPGFGIGNCADTGGSWGEYFVAHRSQVFRVPANVSDEAAILTEPLSVAIHAVQRGLPSDSQTVVVVGAGVIGQCIIAALRAAGCHARIIVLAKYAFQAEMARRMGASEVLTARGEGVIPEIARLTAGKLYRPIIGPRVLVGGADVTYECVGSAASIDQSLRITRGGGRVVLAGLAHKAESVDWTPIWLKELNLQGTFWSG
ncbi:MAG: zinc-binding dehydrogenase, partial [Chloroflexi bacterium]|nr:zinc-binding dehydrogenase [Chloroflexota bacterium]